ncbi:MAG: hypothetical protein J1E62_08590 [Lachnospiraceae bacterium]|nr:hypothetical protein [Lachnospiraceae bacterium]
MTGDEHGWYSCGTLFRWVPAKRDGKPECCRMNGKVDGVDVPYGNSTSALFETGGV